MEKGADGFRVDAAPFYFEYQEDNGNFPDEPLSNVPGWKKDDCCYLNHIYVMVRI